MITKNRHFASFIINRLQKAVLLSRHDQPTMFRFLHIQRLLNGRLPLLGALLLTWLLVMSQGVSAAPSAADRWNDTHQLESPTSIGDESHHQETDSHLLLRTQQHRPVRNAATVVALQTMPVAGVQTKVQTGFQPSPWIEYASPHLAYIHRFFLF